MSINHILCFQLAAVIDDPNKPCLPMAITGCYYEGILMNEFDWVTAGETPNRSIEGAGQLIAFDRGDVH